MNLTFARELKKVFSTSISIVPDVDNAVESNNEVSHGPVGQTVNRQWRLYEMLQMRGGDS